MEIAIILFVIAVIFITRSIKVVPQQNAWVVERLGKYHASLTPGLNFLVPFIDKVAYKHNLKEIPLDIAQPGLHHARQHAAAGRWHPVLPGDRPDARQLWLVQLHRGRDAAGPDVAAQRDRQAGAGQDVRGARHHQRASGAGH
jgi:hypothetical protein